MAVGSPEGRKASRPLCAQCNRFTLRSRNGSPQLPGKLAELKSSFALRILLACLNIEEPVRSSMERESSASPRRTVTRADLAAVVHERLGGSRQAAQRLVDATFSEIMDVLVRGKRAKLVSFGTFVLRTKSARVGRNPNTGVEAQIVARRVVTFKASMTLRDHVSRTPAGASAASDVVHNCGKVDISRRAQAPATR